MLINLRNALMTGKEWKNPYATDGLVAMWDGEWNAGGGKHSDNLNTIVDTSGNGMDAALSPSSTSIPTYQNNGLVFSGGAAYGFSTSNAFKAAYSAKTLTIEIVTRVTGYTNTNRGIFSLLPVTNNESSYNGNPYWRIYADGSYSEDSYYLSNSLSNQVVFNQRFRRELVLGEVYTIAVACTSSAVSGYYNGVFKQTVNRAFLGSSIPAGGWIGAKSGTGSIYHALTGCTLYAIRVYGRILTADEIAANYAIDKARFGLP